MDEMRRISLELEVERLDEYTFRIVSQVAELLSNIGVVRKRIDSGTDKRGDCPTCKGRGKL